MKKNISRHTEAFSLVELSIVLVILGLLTGGILTGQSLIRAAEMRAITTEAEQFATAVNTFKGKYFALPGDLSNATLFWNRRNGAAAPATDCTGSAGSTTTGTASTTGVCNGNGDGTLTGTSANRPTEHFQFWQHLEKAGLINGTYSGIAGTGSDGIHTYITGTTQNVPASKISGAGYQILTQNWSGGSSTRFSYNYINSIMFGAPDTSTNAWSGRLTEPVLTAEEAWNIDTKTDDSLPGLGKLVSTGSNCINGALNAPSAATYRLSNTAKACGFVWRSPF